MTIRKGETVELAIDKMAYGGRGIGRLDGFVVFVRGAMPGDKIRARIYKKKKDYAEANIVQLLDSSSDRIEAPCPYFGYCGGCQWQNVVYERQLEYKKALISEPLERIGGLRNAPVRDVIPSESIFGYRNKMEFSFSDRRWFLPDQLDRRETEGNFALGLHVPGTYSKVIDMDACLLQGDTGNQILREVKRYVKDSGVPVYGLKSHEGFWRFLVVRHSRAFDKWMVNLVTSEDRQEVVHPIVDILSRRVGRVETVVNNINRRKASIAVGEREIVLSGEGYIRDRIGPFVFQVSANSFFQTNTSAARKLYEQVADYAELKGSECVIDLYSGTGTIPIFLAEKAGTITGIELTKSAVLDARKNCRENKIHGCQFINGDIREKLSAISHTPDVLVIDPPRAGMHKDVLAQVLALSPGTIIYVSCNPATLARDLGEMSRMYELIEVQPVDMFPHTYHIEAVAKLCRKKE
ncbi:MAG: 23S rRNA (uracil(1939)-C(5))-methyltransferase RlmD [Desulfobacteraceae bacterium]|nr:23S rRNA (uracil(1939)-C(5))-methyltransferase RlmD [Desulfobacteraceae bacterium]